MKHFIAMICALSLVLALAACAGTESDYSGQSIVGKVTAIDGTKVTLQLGEWSEPDIGEGGQQGAEPPEPPSGENGSEGQTPPEKPSGESGQQGQVSPVSPGQGSGGHADAPAKPSGGDDANGGGDASGSDGQAPPESAADMSGGFVAGDETATFDLEHASIEVESGSETEDGTLDDVAIDSILALEIGEDNAAKTVTVKAAGGSAGGAFGSSDQVNQGTAANTLDSDGTYSDSAYASTGDDENALRIDGAKVLLDGITVKKSAGTSSNTEDGDFYGMNAALLATNGANATIKEATVRSSAQNGNGVFSYGSGTAVKISDSTITTKGDNSGGIQTTGGAAMKAANLTVDTSGNSSAAIRSDRGGGTVQVNGGTYVSHGYNSPAVYSTADITVKNADLTANNSEALVIEGKNSISLKNCDVSGNMSDDKGTSSDENVHNVMVYQSMSGDADVGMSSFSMEGGTLTSANGDMFYMTNTSAKLALSGVKLVNQDSEGYLLRVCGNSGSRGWGTAGSNGAQVVFAADGQKLKGDIAVDSISTLDMTLSGNSSFTGTINVVENEEKGADVSDNAVVTVEKGSTWTLTGDCSITSLSNKGIVRFNGYSITLADGTVLTK